MKTTAILACLVAFASTGRTLAQPPEPIKPLLLQEAASKPLGLIQKSQAEWDRAAPDCVSCHHQILPEFVQSEARGRGIEYDATLARATASKTFAHFRDLDLFVQGYQHIDVMDEAWRLFAAHAAGVPASLTTSAIAQFLASAQRADGGWRTMDARPPQSHSRFTATALCARGVALYLPDSFREERQAVLRRAREWLLKE